jgi:hypothetical protein
MNEMSFKRLAATERLACVDYKRPTSAFSVKKTVKLAGDDDKSTISHESSVVQ